ncbi:Cytochrome c oxidase [Babesia duncani]|uniref:Cytochrome c oxidase n=1 Tax=Babesia duncani TaxID=323732 RepID=A0AAD9PMS1_9APIC|nr:Cytochrome c oxidase [Babesia duncani]
MEINKNSTFNPKELQFWESYDNYTLNNPHAGDARNLQCTNWNYCKLRYTLFCRCCRELGEDDPRCKYQYYRAEIACTHDFLDIVNKHREEGTCSLDILPSRQVHNMRH